MKYRKEGGRIFAVLDRGDEVIASLMEIAKKESVKAATFTGIGAIEQATLGYFDVETKDYEKKEFPFSMELGMLTGNIAMLDGEPLVHAHVLLAGPDLKAYAGHLFTGTVSVTGEILITLHEFGIKRKMNEDIGLNLIELE